MDFTDDTTFLLFHWTKIISHDPGFLFQFSNLSNSYLWFLCRRCCPCHNFPICYLCEIRG